MSRVQVENVYKVFGRRPHEAVERLKAGTPREQITREGRTVAVLDASFDVAGGEIFVVMGLSGSGKSTLLRMLNGLVEPTAGRVLVDGDDITTLHGNGLRRLRAEKLSMVFQHFALFPHHTVLENAAFGLEVQGVARKDRDGRARTALERVGLGDRASSYPGELSGGMQQRVGLARGFATDADVLPVPASLPDP
jgi:glycine betaine/proline transport system ATP-binding protein